MTGSIVPDMEESLYFAHSALSSTQARELLRTPAEYHWNLTHPRPDKPEFDLGHAVHSLVLGTGMPTVVYPETMLGKGGAANTDAARAWAAKMRAEGKTPVKQDVFNTVSAMAESVLAHPMAKVLLEQDADSEVSVFATDPDTGVELRARFDKLPSAGNTPVAVDLKTARDASPRGFTRAAAEHGYAVQRGHYMDCHAYAGGIELDGFVFVVVESTPPFLVGVHRLRSTWEARGVEKARRARRIYKDCVESGNWYGYGDGIHNLTEPFWDIANDAEAESA